MRISGTILLVRHSRTEFKTKNFIFIKICKNRHTFNNYRNKLRQELMLKVRRGKIMFCIILTDYYCRVNLLILGNYYFINNR